MAIRFFSLIKKTGGEEGIEEFNFVTNLHFTTSTTEQALLNQCGAADHTVFRSLLEIFEPVFFSVI